MAMIHDERFEVAEASRRGAHRARPHPVSALLPLIVVAVVVLGAVALAWKLFGGGGTSESTAGSPVTAGGSASAAASSPAGAVAPAPSSGASADPSPAPPASVPAETTVDKSLVLNFFNGTSPQVPGQSRTAARAMEADGWKIGTIQPWTGPAVTQTTVYYADAAQLSTARAVVKALGGGTVKLNTIQARNGLAVVVGNNYAP